MGVPRVLNALENGTMKTIGVTLAPQERYAVTIFLAIPAQKAVPIPPGAFCSSKAQPQPFRISSSEPGWSGWSTDVSNTRFQASAAAGLTAADVPKLKLKWAFGLGDETDARSQPAVADGRMFFGTQDGTVYSLDARTGCIHWNTKVDGDIRSAVAVGGTGHGKQIAVYFGDGRANAYALDAATGKLLWKVHADDHFAARITAAPLLHRGVLFFAVTSFEEALPPLPTYECCTFRGSVIALKAATGQRLWKTYTIAGAPQPTGKNKAGTQMYGPSGAAIWSTPTFDEKRNVVYVSTGDNYSDPATTTSDAVLAMNAKTGNLLWSRQMTTGDAYNNACGFPGSPNCPKSPGHDFDFGQPPILVSLENGRRALVIGQKSGMASALDPDKQGEILWQTRVGKGGALGGIQWGSAADAQNMYVALSDLHIKGIVADSKSAQGYRLQLDSHQGGGLFALRLSSGEKVWSAAPSSVCGDRADCSPAQSGAVAVIPGVIFSGSVDGHLRAYAAATGEIIWDEDTAREYETVNGQHAHGGSLDGPGPVIVDGMLFVNSGYGQWGGMPGNVLLAFSVDGQ
jgi:polyvinyl alcohol dehydrogenase (cytochrome)